MGTTLSCKSHPYLLVAYPALTPITTITWSRITTPHIPTPSSSILTLTLTITLTLIMML
ncbi:hypothetical protein PCASD_20946 [Puccinia coronata f. sp. avenae]|uniref:Uncharacterized protein n=1 Tax=Puccinia coronata f. sp. avenae TaxID=200324 RepID=A0A2N5THH3_9BASI|nr:hypothetical protein PCASD_23681 [Puccinia coronata f. sp. avenae]PLW27358.1 hypothetical protein PCASD_20946 [Puccinia coronata f. sp. avenae]